MTDVFQRFRDDAKAKRGWVRRVHQGTGIPLSTLYAWAKGTRTNPGYFKLKALQEFYAKLDQ